jgi:hypothetical protein
VAGVMDLNKKQSSADFSLLIAKNSREEEIIGDAIKAVKWDDNRKPGS